MGGELVNLAPLPSYTEQFYEHFPFYLSIGMNYEQYWDEDCMLTKYYREAHKIRNKRKNQETWLQGLYFYDALCKVSPILHAFAKSGTKPEPYPEEPYALTKVEKEYREEKQGETNRTQAKAIFKAWADGLNLPKGKEVSVDGDNN